MNKIYLIDNECIFNAGENTLKSKGDDEFKIQLPNASARLLTVLIQRVGEVVPRDALLKIVWEDHGYKGTDNNLNSYISQLRTRLLAIGMSGDIISTIPKQGFRFNANIKELNSEIDSVDEKAITPPLVIYKSMFDNGKDHGIFSVVKRKATLILNEFYIKLSIASLMALIFILIFNNSFSNNKNHDFGVKYFLTKKSDCNIFTLVPFQRNEVDDLISLANGAIRKHGIDCLNGKKIVFFMNAKNNNATKSALILSVCFFDVANGKYYECINIRDPK
ncbi:TPA: transcriptional regulator [Serratia marcescens]